MVRGRPLLNALFKFAGVAFQHGGVPCDIRLSFTNRSLARRSLERLLSWDFDKLIIAHGGCIEKDAKPFVERAFQWLARLGRVSSEAHAFIEKPMSFHVKLFGGHQQLSAQRAERNSLRSFCSSALATSTGHWFDRNHTAQARRVQPVARSFADASSPPARAPTRI
jgi:hypothetical protein